VKYYGITVTAKRRNKSDGERTYPMTERVPFTDLASWQEEGVDSHVVVAADPGGGGWRNINNGGKAYSRSRLIELDLIFWTCLTDGADISDCLRLDNLS
jgi:hypothetical protein